LLICFAASQRGICSQGSGNYVSSNFSQSGNSFPANIGCVQKATIKGGLLTLLQQASMPCVRFHAQLETIFANASQPSWGNLDFNLSQLQAAGIKVMLEVDYTPPSLQTPNLCGPTNESYHTMPSNVQAFGAIAAQLVAHVDSKFPGTVTDYEIWNEPDQTGSFCTANGDQLDNYILLFAAAAPQMEAQARVDGQTMRVGGPTLASSGYFAPTWVKRLVSDPTTAPYVGFVSYHNYIAAALPTWAQLYQLTVTNDDAGPLLNEIKSYVPANMPIYLSEFNSDYSYATDCCRNDPSYSPLWLATYYISLLNSGAMPARTVYYSSSNPPFCIFGATYGDPSCAYPVTGNPVPEPQYYALSLLFSSSYLNLNAGGTIASSKSGVSSLIVAGFATSAGDSIIIANPTGQAVSNLSVQFLNPTTKANSASVWTMQGGQPVASSVWLFHRFNEYLATVNIPAYSVVAVKL
jgi:hypothetical protein